MKECGADCHAVIKEIETTKKGTEEVDPGILRKL